MKSIVTLALFILSTCQLAAKITPQKSLSKQQAAEKSQLIFQQLTQEYLTSIEPFWQEASLLHEEYRMPFWFAVNGDKPEKGYPMYISMHGGGGTAPQVNDGQWNNQKMLYKVENAIYWVPRSPTNTWNMWHQAYMDDFLLQAVTYAVQQLDADPNRIYLMGYSAGGDGTYNLAPRIADRFGAAAMMAGHPGDARAENLRNLPFAIYMGGKDTSYQRNTLAAEWGERLDSLAKTDEGAYIHHTVIYPEKGHWMDGEDKEAIEWLANFTRNPYPEKVVWVQDDVIATRKYNLQVSYPKMGDKLVVNFDYANNRIDITHADYNEITIWLNDNMVNLDKKISIAYQGKEIFKGRLKRTVENIEASILNRYDAAYIFPAKVALQLPQ